MNERWKRRSAEWLRSTGQALIAAGLLVLLFAGYQNWVTDAVQQNSQSKLLTIVHHTLPPGATNRVIGPATPLPTTTDPGVGHWLGVISIPAIDLKQVIVDGTDKSQLQLGPGHYIGTALPGEAGNVGIAGHRTTWGHPFRHLDLLKPGNQIIITTPRAAVLYKVLWKKVVDPTDLSVVAPSTENLLTLTTCNPPYSAATRLVVRAQLVAVGKERPGSQNQPWADKTTILTEQEHYPMWPTYVFGGLLALLLVLAERWRRISARPWLVVVGALVVVTPVVLVWFNAISHVLPAGI